MKHALHFFVFVCASSVKLDATETQLFRLPRAPGITHFVNINESTKSYRKILKKLLPKFQDYIAHEVCIRSVREASSEYPELFEKAFIKRKDPANPKSYVLSVYEERPKTLCTVRGYLLENSINSVWFINSCDINIPPLHSKYVTYAPHSKEEARFLISRELAHAARATDIRKCVELDPSHYPALLNSFRYQWYRRYSATVRQFYRKMWPERANEHNLAATLLALKVGGAKVWLGGISYTSRQIMVAYRKKELLAYCSLSYRSKSRKLDNVASRHAETLRNILLWISNTETRSPITTHEHVVQENKTIRCYYEMIIKRMTQFHELSQPHQAAMLALGTMKKINR